MKSCYTATENNEPDQKCFHSVMAARAGCSCTLTNDERWETILLAPTNARQWSPLPQWRTQSWSRSTLPPALIVALAATCCATPRRVSGDRHGFSVGSWSDTRQVLMRILKRFINQGCIYGGMGKEKRSRPPVAAAVSQITLGDRCGNGSELALLGLHSTWCRVKPNQTIILIPDSLCIPITLNFGEPNAILDVNTCILVVFHPKILCISL